MRSLLLVSALAACTSNPSNAKLAELPNLSLAIQAWESKDTAPTKGFIALGYDAGAFRAAHNDNCATLELTAKLDGKRVGGDGGGGNSDEATQCGFPGFDLSGDLSTAHTVEVSDGTTTITAVLPTDALMPRVPKLISPATWKFAAGESVEVQWPVASDLAMVTPGGMYMWFSGGRNGDFNLTPTVAGDRVRFTMPSPLPDTGAGSIVFSFGWTGGDATTCTGATKCEYAAAAGYVHSATLQ